MRRTWAYVVSSALLAAGCSSAPDVAGVPVASLTPESTAPPAAATVAAVVPDTVVDANEIAARTPPPPICRDILMPNSNVHKTRCMSAEHWKRWEQIEARNAQALTRMLQGGKYR